MSSQKLPISSVVPKQTDIFMLDTNILIKILYPAMNDKNVMPYENLYAALLAAKSKLFISSIQISEFINRCIRFQFALYKDSEDNREFDFKKDYRNTDDYRNSMTAILDIINFDIIPNYTFIDDGFSKMQNDQIFRYGFSYDFNDSLLLEIASQNHAMLITDDRDFANYSSDEKIITNNKTLLMFS